MWKIVNKPCREAKEVRDELSTIEKNSALQQAVKAVWKLQHEPSDTKASLKAAAQQWQTSDVRAGAALAYANILRDQIREKEIELDTARQAIKRQRNVAGWRRRVAGREIKEALKTAEESRKAAEEARKIAEEDRNTVEEARGERGR
ncbi:hypothetical protein B0H13DRAFT_1892172 [Mycena leptocephala]|nr:hypothetical protein B0H13DRAFT_1892172 [Mycena leptocephala]